TTNVNLHTSNGKCSPNQNQTSIKCSDSPPTSPVTHSTAIERRPRRDKQARMRTVLNEKQLHTLKSCYAYNPRPDALLKEQLCDMTGLNSRVIRVWFQNKRCKDKKKNVATQNRNIYSTDKLHRMMNMSAISPIVPDGIPLMTDLGHMTVLNQCDNSNNNGNVYDSSNSSYLSTRDGMIYALSSNDDISNTFYQNVPGTDWKLRVTYPSSHITTNCTVPQSSGHDTSSMMPSDEDSLDQSNSDFSDS
ncbi:unnamed protein product, partial [Didymodactylos carnosus]